MPKLHTQTQRIQAIGRLQRARTAFADAIDIIKDQPDLGDEYTEMLLGYSRASNALTDIVINKWTPSTEG